MSTKLFILLAVQYRNIHMAITTYFIDIISVFDIIIIPCAPEATYTFTCQTIMYVFVTSFDISN